MGWDEVVKQRMCVSGKGHSPPMLNLEHSTVNNRQLKIVQKSDVLRPRLNLFTTAFAVLDLYYSKGKLTKSFQNEIKLNDLKIEVMILCLFTVESCNYFSNLIYHRIN